MLDGIVMIPPHSIIAANVVGLALYPLAWWQFAGTKNRGEFLIANFLTCIVFAASFALTSQYTAALISTIAALSTIIQKMRIRLWHRWVVTTISAVSVFFIAPRRHVLVDTITQFHMESDSRES